MEKAKDGDIHIGGVQGDVSGVSIGGSGNIVGKNIEVGSGTINVSQQQLAKIPSEYAESLKAFSNTINQQLRNCEIPEEQVKSINQSMIELAKEVEDVKPGKSKKLIMKSKQRSNQKLPG